MYPGNPEWGEVVVKTVSPSLVLFVFFKGAERTQHLLWNAVLSRRSVPALPFSIPWIIFYSAELCVSPIEIT